MSNDSQQPNAAVHTGVTTDTGVPAVAVIHPAADPMHPDHEAFLKRLSKALGDVAFDTGVLAATGGVLRIGVYAHDKKDDK